MMAEDWDKYEVSYDPLGRWEKFEATAPPEQQAEAQPPSTFLERMKEELLSLGRPSAWLQSWERMGQEVQDPLSALNYSLGAVPLTGLGRLVTAPKRAIETARGAKAIEAAQAAKAPVTETLVGKTAEALRQVAPEALPKGGVTLPVKPVTDVTQLTEAEKFKTKALFPLETETVSGAALKKKNGTIITGERFGIQAKTHADIYNRLSLNERKEIVDTVGYITSRGRYLTDKEAANLVGGIGAKTIDASDIVGLPVGKPPTFEEALAISDARTAKLRELQAKFQSPTSEPADALNSLINTQKEVAESGGKFPQSFVEQLSAKFEPKYKAPWGGKFEPRNYDVTPDNIRKLSLQERAQQLNTKAAQETDTFITKIEKQSQLGEAGKITKGPDLHTAEYNRLVEENFKTMKKMELTVSSEDLKQPSFIETPLEYVTRLRKQVETGIMPAYHGTTEAIKEKIFAEGFKPIVFEDVVREAYKINNIDWIIRKRIPSGVRKWIEGDARSRILGKEGGVISFAPTKEVAERWAGKGGEVLHETDKRVREYLAAKGSGAKTEEEIFNWLEKNRGIIKYRDLGKPSIVEANIKLTLDQKDRMLSEIRSLERAIKDHPEEAEDIILGWKHSYKDLRVAEPEILQTTKEGVTDLNPKSIIKSEEGFLNFEPMMYELKQRGIVGSEFPDPKDFRNIYQFLQLPHDMAISHPVFKPIFNSAMAREATRNAQVRKYYDITKPYFELSSPADRAIVDKALLLGDRLKVTLSTPILQKLKLTPRQIEAYNSIAKGTDAVLDDLAAGMKRHGVEQAKITEFITELRDKGFVPHKWFGKYGIVVQEPKLTQPIYGGAAVTRNKTIYMTARESELEANLEFDRLVTAYPGKLVKRIKRGEMEQLASFDVPPYAIQAMIDKAAKRAGTDPIVAQELSKALHDLRLAKGMGAHFIKRKWTPGYEENLERPLAEYFMGMSGYVAKVDAMKEFTEGLKYIKTPNLRKYTIEYIESMFSSDRHNVINTAKSLMFHYQLGTSVKFGVMNLMQNAITGVPVLSKYTSFPEAKMLKAMSDVALRRLAPDELAAIKFAKDNGLLETKFIHEALIGKGDPFSHHGKLATITDISSYIPNLTEEYNRVSGFVAGYRALRDKGGRGSMLTPGSLPDLAKGASEITNEYNFIYGKADRVLAARPDFLKGIASPIMTFRLFGINYVTMLKNFTKEHEWAALARAIGIMTGIAGTGGYVGAGAFEDWYNHFTGHDIRQDTRDWVSGKVQTVMPKEWGDRIGMMATDGLPAAVGPVTFSRSIGMGDLVPLDPTGLTTEAITKMLGVFAGQGSKLGTAYRAYEFGDYLRAAENVSPQFLQSIMTAYRLRTQGSRNLAFQETLDPMTGKQIKLTTPQAIYKGIGFQPVAAAEAQRRVGITYDINEYMISKGLKAAKLADGAINRGELGRALQILNTTMKEDPRIAKITAQHIRDWIGPDIPPMIKFQIDRMLEGPKPPNMP